MKYYLGQMVAIIESNQTIRHGSIISINGEFCTVKFNNGGGIKVRKSRLFTDLNKAEYTLKTTRLFSNESRKQSSKPAYYYDPEISYNQYW